MKRLTALLTLFIFGIRFPYLDKFLFFKLKEKLNIIKFFLIFD
ncbi:hypothetical protein CSU_0810 [Campylobacter jejuni subsp. jejuni 327]|nr:hypothetical protein CSU_0810 [Campylobacter jejuni subsp. jejuni 327]